jgi:raffinose/stachyose/melibiose transport system permease protein
MSARKGSVFWGVLSYVVILFIVLAALCPFAVLLWRFFTGGASLLRIWKLGNFGFLLLNSFIYAAVSALAAVVLGFMAGFCLSKFRVKINSALYVLFAFGIFFVLQPVVVPLFLGSKASGLFDSRIGVLISCLGMGLPLGVCLGAEFIKSIPDAVIESARLDGAGYFRIFRSIIFPMAAPAAALIGALVFTITWNEFLLISVLTASPAGASLSGAASLNTGLAAFAAGAGKSELAPALVISLIPSLVIFLFLKKQFIRAVGMIRG